MYVILVEKTEGEARTKMTAAGEGNSIQADVSVYTWLVETIGFAISERVNWIRSSIRLTQGRQLQMI